MASYWCEWAWLGAVDGRMESGVLIEVSGDRIAEIVTNCPVVPDDAVRLSGLTLPGLVNGHSHAFHRGLRSRTHAKMGTFWTWRDQMFTLAERLDPDSYRALATATFAEMVLAGFTTVGEFHYIHHGRNGVPYSNANEMSSALIDAANIAGIRITLIDTCYLQAGVVPHAELNPIQRRFSDGTADQWAERAEAMTNDSRMGSSSTIRFGAAIHSVRSVPRTAMAQVAEWASRRNLPLHAHVSEQPAENEQCFEAHGITPTELLHDSGALNERFTAVHATHVTVNDRSLYATTGSTCCICPTTERDLADGIGPTAALRTANVSMSIGTDSHAVVDPFEEIRAIELNQRLTTLSRGTHQPGELLGIATSNGARSLGWHDTGRIASGALADFTTVSLDSIRLAGTDSDSLAAAMVYAATTADVRHVVVGGRVIVADGLHQSIDVPSALAKSIRELWS